MNKAEKKFRLYAVSVIGILLTVLLAVINGVSFTMAAADADNITQTIAGRKGSFERKEDASGASAAPFMQGSFRMGPMGPDSPETKSSVRYFTIAFSDNGRSVETVAFQISAVTEQEARQWASELMNEETGWTRGTYRYRVYKDHGVTYVTVIDQGRELLSAYRILIISAVGEVLVLIIGWFVLLFIGRRIYAPVEEADRKQRNFIRNVNREFRDPLDAIDVNTDLAERRNGPDEQTRSTHQQIARLKSLVNRLGKIGILDDQDMKPAEIILTEYLKTALDRQADEFTARGIMVSEEIETDVRLAADPQSMEKLMEELVDNALKFSLTKASFVLKNDSGHVLLEVRNDADLPDGSVDQVFDRFTVLGNATDGAGLGLAYVKGVVKAHNGRATASVSDGVFRLRIML